MLCCCSCRSCSHLCFSQQPSSHRLAAAPFFHTTAAYAPSCCIYLPWKCLSCIGHSECWMLLSSVLSFATVCCATLFCAFCSSIYRVSDSLSDSLGHFALIHAVCPIPCPAHLRLSPLVVYPHHAPRLARVRVHYDKFLVKLPARWPLRRPFVFMATRFCGRSRQYSSHCGSWSTSEVNVRVTCLTWCLSASMQLPKLKLVFLAGSADIAHLATAAATPGFLGHSGDGGVVDRICSGVMRLPKEAARKLASALADIPQLVWNGETVFVPHAEALQVAFFFSRPNLT